MPSGAVRRAENILVKHKRVDDSPLHLGNDAENDSLPAAGKRPRKVVRSSAAHDDTQSLACPFWKFDPTKYRDCFKNRFSRLVQGFFSGEVDLREHIDSSKCTARPDSFGPIGKSFTYSISAPNWYAVNGVGKRGRPAPKSPYVETGFSSADLFLFYQHLTSASSQNLFDFIERQRVFGERTTPSTITDFLKGFYHDWRHGQDSTASSTDEGQPKSQEVWAASAKGKLNGEAGFRSETKAVLPNKEG
ncbi:hypothetical protein B0H67DRAFT_556930 [Lasiosphaeris hirsuta]|uniref:Uncharacterized protein n=1 Tax=Lasiosphaeris hirsuta TaxID=260670 RepID=A0AA40A382_9PEZI|nr:hypothetical protein B0H67DRAFT_556930 [Lasiosphaeris hirsuta]